MGEESEGRRDKGKMKRERKGRKAFGSSCMYLKTAQLDESERSIMAVLASGENPQCEFEGKKVCEVTLFTEYACLYSDLGQVVLSGHQG